MTRLRLAQIQQIEADNRRRLDAGHSRVDINALGEPGFGPVRACACGCEVCSGDLTGATCTGGITVMKPGAVVELHLCAAHHVNTIAVLVQGTDHVSLGYTVKVRGRR